MKRSEWKEQIEALPKGMTMGEVAKQLGKGYTITAFYCKLFKYPAASGRVWTKKRLKRSWTAPWPKLNWRLGNSVLARRYGVSREIVRRQRKVYGNGSKPR